MHFKLNMKMVMVSYCAMLILSALVSAHTCLSYLSHHPIPDIVNLLAMLAIGYQVQVIGEPHVLCNLLQNIDAEAFAALLDVRPTSLCCVALETQTNNVIS